MTSHQLQWQKHYPLSDKNAFICLVDHMGDDSSIIQAARVSYGKDERYCEEGYKTLGCPDNPYNHTKEQLEEAFDNAKKELAVKDRQLIRYLMNHSHTTPFEMVEIKFMVQVPMDCWRQWIRHRTASVNEYSTRYTEALDFFQVTQPTEWRLQSSDNKQGSSGYLEEWPDDINKGDLPYVPGPSVLDSTPGQYLTRAESWYNTIQKNIYDIRLAFGIAKEQARKDLPLSTYTRAYWKCDLHNIFNFLRLRMDSHAQLEIRSFANCMFEIVKQLCPVACEAFEDYVLHAKKFSRMEMEYIRSIFAIQDFERDVREEAVTQHTKMTDREWKEFLAKLN